MENEKNVYVIKSGTIDERVGSLFDVKEAGQEAGSRTIYLYYMEATPSEVADAMALGIGLVDIQSEYREMLTAVAMPDMLGHAARNIIDEMLILSKVTGIKPDKGLLQEMYEKLNESKQAEKIKWLEEIISYSA